jgi:hypothetical protein
VASAYRDAHTAGADGAARLHLLFFFLDLAQAARRRGAGGQIVIRRRAVGVRAPGQAADHRRHHGQARLTSRVGFLAGVPMSQISEFSLILAALGFTLGHSTATA